MRISDWSSDVCSSDLNAVAEHIRQQGGNAETHACDVTEPFAFEQLKAQALVRFGAVHIIMNNIAAVSCGLPEDIPVEEWQRAFDVNLMSIVRSNHVFLPLFIAQGDRNSTRMNYSPSCAFGMPSYA